MTVLDPQYLHWILSHTRFDSREWMPVWIYANKLNRAMAAELNLDPATYVELFDDKQPDSKKIGSAGGSSGSDGRSGGGGGNKADRAYSLASFVSERLKVVEAQVKDFVLVLAISELIWFNLKRLTLNVQKDSITPASDQKKTDCSECIFSKPPNGLSFLLFVTDVFFVAGRSIS